MDTEHKPSPNDGLDLPPLMSFKEVADFLHCTVRTVYRLVESGALRAPYQIGPNMVRFRGKHVADFYLNAPPVAYAPENRAA